MLKFEFPFDDLLKKQFTIVALKIASNRHVPKRLLPLKDLS
jgi:hypothetical protein